MTVKELREQLEQYGDDVPVILAAMAITVLLCIFFYFYKFICLGFLVFLFICGAVYALALDFRDDEKFKEREK